MFRRLNLAGLFLLTLTSPAFAAEGGFTWANFLFGGLAEPLASIGIDPRPILDMIIVAAVLIGLAWWLGKPFRETQMLEPSGRLDKDHQFSLGHYSARYRTTTPASPARNLRALHPVPEPGWTGSRI
ncbi:MAG: hypothetical protein ACO20P_02645 [bacterium]